MRLSKSGSFASPVGQGFSTYMRLEGLIAQQEIWSFREVKRGTLNCLRHAGLLLRMRYLNAISLRAG